MLGAAREPGAHVPELPEPVHRALRDHRQPAAAVPVAVRVAGRGDDGHVEASHRSHAVREAPARGEEPRRVLQLLLARGAQVQRPQQQHDGVTHVSHALTDGGAAHAEQSADGAVLYVRG